MIGYNTLGPGLYDGMGYINIRGLHDGTRDEAIARLVTGYLKRIYNDLTTMGYMCIEG